MKDAIDTEHVQRLTEHRDARRRAYEAERTATNLRHYKKALAKLRHAGVRARRALARGGAIG